MIVDENDSENQKNVQKFTYVTVPSEKGYAYVICCAVMMTFICLYSYMSSIGMIFNDLVEKSDNGKVKLTLILGVNVLVTSMTGMAANVAIKFVTVRKLCIFSGLIFALAWILMIFVTHLEQLFLTYGVLVAVSTGLSTSLVFAVFQTYFVKSRTQVMACCQVVVQCVTMLFPLFFNYIHEELGYRGSVMVLAGIFANMILAAVCLHPVEWHSERRKVYESVEQQPLDNKISEQDREIYEQGKLMPENIYAIRDQNPNGQKSMSFVKRRILLLIIKYLDLSLFKRPFFGNLVIGIAIVLACDACYFMTLPSHLYDLKYESIDIANLIAIISASDLAGRIFLAVCSKYIKCGNRDLFFYGIIVEGISRSAFLLYDKFWYLVTVSTMMGFFRPFLHLMTPLVCAEYDSEKFVAIYGITNSIVGLSNVMVYPLTAYFHKIMGGFVEIYHVLSIFTMLCAVSWSVELWHTKSKTFKR